MPAAPPPRWPAWPRPGGWRRPGCLRSPSSPARDIAFDYGPPLPGHANGLVLSAWDDAGNLHLRETYYSIGGGFVLTAHELEHPRTGDDGPAVPHPFASAAELLRRAGETGLVDRRAAAGERARAAAGGGDRLRAGAALVGDEREHRPRPRRRGRVAGRAQGAAPRPGDPRAAPRRARAEPDGPAHGQRLDRHLRDRRERGERGRRPGGDGADQRRGRGRAGDAALLPRPRAGGHGREDPRVPADRRGDRQR